jgi:hypothetical protein
MVFAAQSARRRTASLVRPVVAAFLVLLAAGCGPRVARLSLHDPRLPLEARRWLADAEDEVAIAAVSLEEAQHRLEEAHQFRDYASHLNWPGAAGNARQRLDQMVRERIDLANDEVDAANQRVAVAQAQLVRARAETAVRHDIAAYDLEPITAAADAARQQLDAAVQRVEQQQIASDTATTQFWEAYGTYLRGAGANAAANILWTWTEEAPNRF